jgi:molecular chaperone DnaK (HSP70)
MGKKLYIGYDLGDGETITDIALIDSAQNFNITDYPNMTMPGSTEKGKALPTAYAYNDKGEVVFSYVIAVDFEKVRNISTNFKRKPLDLIQVSSNEDISKLLQLFDNDNKKWPDSSMANTPKILEYRKKVIEFTNAIFENEVYKETIRSLASNGNAIEIVITVGHPTKWSKLDALIYKKILSGSVLGEKTYAGYPVSLVLAQESRAAFLYERQINGLAIPKNTCVMLVDVGSSTIDITALTADSRNSQYNSGNNYLGARAIDWLIFEWYLEELFKKNADFMSDYNDIIINNPTAEMSLLLNCRKAKEEIFSTQTLSKILFADFPVIRLQPEKLSELIDKRPIAPVLKRYVGIPDEVTSRMGNKSWRDLFYEFMAEEHKALSDLHSVISKIIFTGSASRMPVVKKVTQEVFYKIPTSEDMDPSRTISKGLVAVGASNDKSSAFQKDISQIIKTRIPKIIEEDIPALVDGVGTVSGIGNAVADIIENIVITEFSSWKKGKHKTINDATAAIKRECTEETLSAKLNGSSSYKSAISNWYKNKVGKDIAMELQELCKKYRVQEEFKINDLNIVDINIDGIAINGGQIVDLNAVDVIGTVVSILAGIIAAIILPFVLGLIVGIISWISVTIASLLFTILMAIPGPGYIILAAIAGIGAWALIAGKFEESKDLIRSKIVAWDLPNWVREKVTDEKIKTSLKRDEIIAKIKTALGQENSRKKIVDQLMVTLNSQINIKADEIKYTIESM